MSEAVMDNIAEMKELLKENDSYKKNYVNILKNTALAVFIAYSSYNLGKYFFKSRKTEPLVESVQQSEKYVKETKEYFEKNEEYVQDYNAANEFSIEDSFLEEPKVETPIAKRVKTQFYPDDIYRTNKRAKWHMSSIKANKSILNNLEFRVEDNEYQLDLRDIPLDGILPNGKVDPALWKKSIRYRELVLRLDITDGETKEIIHIDKNGITYTIDPKYLVIENGKAKDFNDLVVAFYVEFARDDFDFHGYARPDGRKELHIIAASSVPPNIL